MKCAAYIVLLLGACSSQAIIDSAYPDREKFAFRSLNGESIFTYTCEPAANVTATKERAQQAHKYLDARFTKAVNGTVEVIIESKGSVSPRGINNAIDKEVEDIVTQTEERYKCLFMDYRDA